MRVQFPIVAVAVARLTYFTKKGRKPLIPYQATDTNFTGECEEICLFFFHPLPGDDSNFMGEFKHFNKIREFCEIIRNSPRNFYKIYNWLRND
jgi:hypothetical protein